MSEGHTGDHAPATLLPRAVLVGAFLLVTGAPSHAQTGDAAAEFLRRSFGDAGYQRAEADLNGDGQPEVFAYVTDPRLCGSGGCNLLVLSPHDGHFRVVLRTPVAQRPIAVLSTSSWGWRDVGVTVAGGGIRSARMVRLRYDERRERYPSNPTLEPGPWVAADEGEVLIGA